MRLVDTRDGLRDSDEVVAYQSSRRLRTITLTIITTPLESVVIAAFTCCYDYSGYRRNYLLLFSTAVLSRPLLYATACAISYISNSHQRRTNVHTRKRSLPVMK